MADTLAVPVPPHPYQPTTLSLPGYDPSKQLDPLHALLYIFVPATLLLLLTYHYTGTLRLPPTSTSTRTSTSTSTSWPQHLTRSERVLTSWYTLTFVVHAVFEGTFLLHAPHHTLHSSGGLLAGLWREYARCDSRYLLPARDPRFTFIHAIELVTVCGTAPLCAVCAWGLARRRDWRAVPMLVVSTAHVWGVAMYFLTAALDAEVWGRREVVYTWGYFWGMNAPWLGVSLAVVWWVLRRELVRLRGGGEAGAVGGKCGVREVEVEVQAGESERHKRD